MRRKSKRIVRNLVESGYVGKAINHLDSQVIPICLSLWWVKRCLNKANNKIRDGNYNDTLPTHLDYIRCTENGTYAIRTFSPPRLKQIALIAFAGITAFMAPNVISELGLSGYINTAVNLAWEVMVDTLSGFGITIP